MYVCVYVYMYVCVCVYIYTYIYMYNWVHTAEIGRNCKSTIIKKFKKTMWYLHHMEYYSTTKIIK